MFRTDLSVTLIIEYYKMGTAFLNVEF
jgi:hypothetical protein